MEYDKTKYNKYIVGESNTKYPYDDKFELIISKNDLYIQDKFKKGYLFSKYVTMAIYNFCKKDDVIFDIGANIGSISIPCAKWFKVYSFEPFTLNFNALKYNVEVNNLSNNVVLFNKAVGHQNMITNLSTTISDNKEKKKVNDDEKFNFGAIQLGHSGEETEMITLDSLMDDVKKVSLIKVDVEGAEPLVFYGAKNIIARDLPIIIFEKNKQNITDEMKTSMKLTKNIITFDIIQYCDYLKYDKLVYIHLEDYMIIPPGRKQILNDEKFKLKSVISFPLAKIHELHIPNSFKLFQLEKTKWGGQQEVSDSIASQLTQVEYEPYYCKKHDFIKPKDGKYAYCTLLMIDDSYLPGVLTLGYSLKKMGTTYDTLVLTTPDVSNDAKKEIKKIYTRIIEVDYIIPLSGIIKIPLVKKYPHYGKTFTKLNCLSLEEYDAIMFLDADTIVFKNYDSLFSLTPPAAVYYGSHKMHENNYKPRLKGDHYKWHTDYCECCDHGKKIDADRTDVINHDMYGMSTECMLLKPDKKLLKEIINEIHSETFKNKYKNGFLSDAGYITWKYSGQWTGMDPRFLGRRGYPRIEDLFGITLGGSKPWLIENVKYGLSYPDYKIWYEYFLEMCDEYKIKKFDELRKIVKEKINTKHVYILIILPNTSGGLLHDADIFKKYFEKHLTNTTIKIITPETKLTINKYSDVNIFLESINDSSVDSIFRSQFNMFMVNQEFFDYDRLTLQIKNSKQKNIPEYNYNKTIDLFLCKTIAGVNFLNELEKQYDTKLKKIYTRFTTLFNVINIKKNYNKFLHTAGSSPLKNTDIIINSWKNINKDLIITCYDRCLSNLKKYVKGYDTKFITLYDKKQNNDMVVKLCNEIGNHLCPSMVEGYGHYINQGRITSSIILTIDAEPMNELIDNKSGILIPYSEKIKRKNGSYMYSINENDVINGINKMLKLTDNQRKEIGNNVRKKYDDDTIFFDNKIKEICDMFQSL